LTDDSSILTMNDEGDWSTIDKGANQAGLPGTGRYPMFTTFVAMKTYLLAHIKSERGATMVEYGILVGLIAVAAIAAIVILGGNVNDAFEGVNDEFPPPPPPL
jgi:pilus assembly protein Flp/PilA